MIEREPEPNPNEQAGKQTEVASHVDVLAETPNERADRYRDLIADFHKKLGYAEHDESIEDSYRRALNRLTPDRAEMVARALTLVVANRELARGMQEVGVPPETRGGVERSARQYFDAAMNGLDVDPGKIEALQKVHDTLQKQWIGNEVQDGLAHAKEAAKQAEIAEARERLDAVGAPHAAEAAPADALPLEEARRVEAEPKQDLAEQMSTELARLNDSASENGQSMLKVFCQQAERSLPDEVREQISDLYTEVLASLHGGQSRIELDYNGIPDLDLEDAVGELSSLGTGSALWLDNPDARRGVVGRIVADLYEQVPLLIAKSVRLR